jgi:hypothetical protein
VLDLFPGSEELGFSYSFYYSALSITTADGPFSTAGRTGLVDRGDAFYS